MHASVSLLVSALLAFAGRATCQLPSPCPEVLRYEPLEKDADRWNAVVGLKSSVDLGGVWIQIELDKPADVLINWFGESSSSDNKNFLIKNENYVLTAGKTLDVKVAVKFSQADAIPSVTAIRLNGGVICPTDPKNSDWPRPVERGEGSPPVAIPPRKDSPDVCGTVPLKGRPLVYNGQKAEEGQWPWHVALTVSQNDKLTYSCGGTLISTTFVVTAAHCVTKLSTKILLDFQHYFVYLGTNNLRNFTAGFQLHQVEDVALHPDYNPRYFYNDIALIKLARLARISDFVRPVCLWEGTLNVGAELGTVVGWGVDNTSSTTTTILNEAKMPIVPLDTCIFSDRDFFSQYTSEKTFCAGNRKGTTVCRGDSGGGMVFPRKGTSGEDTIWQLRGLVSVSYPTRDPCETDHYVVFTDVAKHSPWIKRIVGL